MFPKSFKIGNYTILFHIKSSDYAETYRVKGDDGILYFMKVLDCTKIKSFRFEHNRNINEIELVKKIKHKNIINFKETGTISLLEKEYKYIVHDYISGETVAQKLMREQHCTVYEAKSIIKDVLTAVSYLHKERIIHNELTIQNVMIDMAGQNTNYVLIDFGYSQPLNKSKQPLDNRNPFYLAPECFDGKFTVQTDIYSIGAMFYHLLFGLPPYFVDLPNYEDVGLLYKAITNEQKKGLKILNKELYEFDEHLLKVLKKSLATNVDDRYNSCTEFLNDLNSNSGEDVKPKAFVNTVETVISGNGFAGLAGMEDLKKQLQSDVVNVLKNPKKAESLGINIPNGILLYGPPGCGKTFFAEKFAEELKCNYMYILCSDVASPYIHGGQEKIAKIFDEARKNAPTVIFLDEVEAMIKDRNKHTNVSEAGEVNEFLGQLNNCGKDGVLVIAATNNPKDIDSAALRAGRLELKYYISPPDAIARKDMFKIHLKNRAVSDDIDYSLLSELTNNFVSSDIKLIVDTAARFVFKNDLDQICMEHLIETIRNFKPTVSLETIKKHEQIRDDFNGVKNERPRIGF